MSMLRWTIEEKMIMADLYATEGIGVAKLLKNRTKQSIYLYASKHGFKKAKAKEKEAQNNRTYSKWSKEDIQTLQKEYPKMGALVTTKLNDAHSKNSIYQMANKLNLKKENRKDYTLWTKREAIIMHAYYPSMGTSIVAKLPNRSVSDCMQYAHRKHIKSKVFDRNWLTNEDKQLLDEFAYLGVEECMLLTGRSKSCVKNYIKKIKELRFSRLTKTWSNSETQFITVNYSTKTVEWLSVKLHRTKKAIYNKASELQIRKVV